MACNNLFLRRRVYVAIPMPELLYEEMQFIIYEEAHAVLVFLHSRLYSIWAINCISESIEWLIEDRAFLRPYDSAPRPCSPLPFPPHPSATCSISFSILLTGEGGRGWSRSKIIRPRESLPSINYSILSGLHPLIWVLSYTNSVCRLRFNREYISWLEINTWVKFPTTEETRAKIPHKLPFCPVNIW